MVERADYRMKAMNRDADMEIKVQKIALIWSAGHPWESGALNSQQVSSGEKIYRMWIKISLRFIVPPGGKDVCLRSYVYENRREKQIQGFGKIYITDCGAFYEESVGFIQIG